MALLSGHRVWSNSAAALFSAYRRFRLLSWQIHAAHRSYGHNRSREHVQRTAADIVRRDSSVASLPAL